MGQTYCCDRNTIEVGALPELTGTGGEGPVASLGVAVKQHIELHSKVKETYMLYRTPHAPTQKGTKLPLHYLFPYCAYYEGEWKNGLPHGFGRVIYDDGSLYEGCFTSGTADCKQALFIKNEGTFFRGSIRNNMANGYGELSTPKLFYKGHWVDDLPQGHAR